jgi:hypothetical protein
MNPAINNAPQVEVLPPEGGAEQPTEKGAVVQVEKSGRSRGRSQSSEGKGVTPAENEVHKRAFAFYYSLGPERSLAKVAEMFMVHEGTVKNWSGIFGWKKRLEEQDAFSDIELADRLNAKALRMKGQKFFEPDPENPGREKLTEFATMTAIKDHRAALNAAKEIRLREQEASKEPGQGARGPKGVMVNVIIKK